MRFRLRTLIAGLLTACIAPVVAVSTVVLVRTAQERFWKEAQDYGVSFANTVLSATRHSMLTMDRTELEAILDAVSRQKGVRAARIYDAQGHFRVPVAHRAPDLDLSGAECTLCHPDPRRIDAPAQACVHRNEDGLRLYHAILNDPECIGGACHRPSERLLGVLEVDIDVSEALARSHKLTMWAVIGGLLVLGGAVVPLFFALRWGLERPLTECLRIVRGVAAGDLSVRSVLSPATEWAELLGALDGMTLALSKARTDLEALNRHLEEQVAHRTRALEAALQVAEESDRMKTEFLAGISHEFATPLQGAIGFADLLLDGIDGELALSQRHDIEVVRRNCRELLALVEDLLDVVRLSGTLTPSKVDRVRLETIAEEVVEAGRRLAVGRAVDVGLEIEPGCPAVLGDAAILRHVLFHLVEYAVRHTDEGRVAVRVAKAAGNRVELSVSDTGAGVQTEVLRSAVQGYSPQGGGSGIGIRLAFVRRLVELRGAEFSVESIPGNGTRVVVRLPTPVDDPS
ncbi:MAG: hypothetical protein HZB55_05020 [Deltaproteobacteria bacterium]|nr:hypothetical protein [Deltaproteobacteria bacterium]